jgi:hypothetical protein
MFIQLFGSGITGNENGPRAAGATRRCPVQPSTPLGPDQVNVLLLLMNMATAERSDQRRPGVFGRLASRVFVEYSPADVSSTALLVPILVLITQLWYLSIGWSHNPGYAWRAKPPIFTSHSLRILLLLVRIIERRAASLNKIKQNEIHLLGLAPAGTWLHRTTARRAVIRGGACQVPKTGDGCLAVPLNSAELPVGENLRGGKRLRLRFWKGCLVQHTYPFALNRPPLPTE